MCWLFAPTAERTHHAAPRAPTEPNKLRAKRGNKQEEKNMSRSPQANMGLGRHQANIPLCSIP